ncbi:MAG: hypothetical protein HUK06_06765 [Bacteroidaceae bacterium]|nr:hypothetical protein [Bacteroidaceae bacterium]
MKHPNIYSATTLTEFIHEIGFLPLLDSGICGYSADEVADDDCRYVVFPEGGWDWPLWKWKGEIVTEGETMYGKFFNKKAGFIAKEWWADFCNYRRNKYALPKVGTIEEAILATLKENGSLITRELRAACGFDGKGMRSKFDTYITRLQMATYIVTEDFVYPHDKHGKQYGWGWSLLTTPETLCGREFCKCERTPEESFQRLYEHFTKILPEATDKQIKKLIE